MASRIATAADIDAIVRVVNRAYRVEEFFVTGDRTRAADVAARMRTARAHFLVIDGEPLGGERGVLAGSVYVEIRGDRGYFAMLSVDPDFQKRGLGRELVSAAEDHCRAAGCNVLEIDVVNLRAELPAFYAPFGFAAFGTAPFPEPGKLLSEAHLVLMRKTLA